MRTQALSHQETRLFVEITATPVAFSTSHLLGRSQQHIPDIVQLDGQLTACGDLPVYQSAHHQKHVRFSTYRRQVCLFCTLTRKAPYFWACVVEAFADTAAPFHCHVSEVPQLQKKPISQVGIANFITLGTVKLTG